jgi:hypothetical protein
MFIECRTVPASLLRMLYMAYEAQYDDERGTEGDWYDSKEIDESYLQAALNRYAWKTNLLSDCMSDNSVAPSGATAQTPAFCFSSAVHSCFCDMINTNKCKKLFFRVFDLQSFIMRLIVKNNAIWKVKTKRNQSRHFFIRRNRSRHLFLTQSKSSFFLKSNRSRQKMQSEKSNPYGSYN